jgi:hypothetical protein
MLGGAHRGVRGGEGQPFHPKRVGARPIGSIQIATASDRRGRMVHCRDLVTTSPPH